MCSGKQGQIGNQFESGTRTQGAPPARGISARRELECSAAGIQPPLPLQIFRGYSDPRLHLIANSAFSQFPVIAEPQAAYRRKRAASEET